MTSFSDLGLAAEINRAIRDSGYTEPTLIQQQMIPLIKQGKDVIGLSQTGTGKTAAFVLPFMDKLATSKKRARRGSCSVLVLSPTRELTNQIAETVRRYGKYVNYTQAIIVGGVSYPPQIKALRRGADIVIATPGRALDHIESGELSLDETTTIILDEADQMLDFGFMPVVKKITDHLPQERQSVLLSATMPKGIKKLAEDLMTDPELVEATPESKPVERISQEIIYVERQRKNMALLEIISRKEVERAIVFTRTKFGADRVQTFLNNYGVLAVALHGNKSQGQRQRALGQFRRGDVNVLVATDVAGRGIDIDDVSHVINVDLPNIPESYVHRIGRTARAGREGVAISFCSKAEKSYLRDIEKLIGMDLPKRQDQPGAVPIKPSDAAPLQFADGDRNRRKSDRGTRDGTRGGGRDRKFAGRDGKRDQGREFRGDRKSAGKWAEKPDRPKAKSYRPHANKPHSAKPKPVDPNLYFPDELTKDQNASFDQKPKGKPKGQPRGKKSFDQKSFEKKSSSRQSDGGRSDDRRSFKGKSDGGKPFKGKSDGGKPFKGKSDGGKPFKGKSFKQGKPSNSNSAGKKTSGKKRFDAPAEKGLRRRSR